MGYFLMTIFSSLLILQWTLFLRNSAGLSINQIKPSCRSRGWPPRMLLLTYLPSAPVTSNSNDTVTYNGHYCYPNMSSKFCSKPELGYKQMNCTATLADGVLIKCNMTDLLQKLYGYGDSSNSGQRGSQLCMKISVTNRTNTMYSNYKCCNTIKNSKFSPIKDLKLKASSKGELNMTWSSPSNIDINTKGFIRYIFNLTMPDNQHIKKTIIYSPSNWRSPHLFYIIKDLEPYTVYRVTVAVFLNDPSMDGIVSEAIETHTLPEAPSVPPVLTEAQIISKNVTERNVRVKWKHPPKEKRNGIIIQTVIEYQRGTDYINASLPFYHKLTVNGDWTMVVLTDLVLSADYVMTMQSCTSPVDCSKHSVQITLEGIPPKPQPSKPSNGFKIHSLAFILSIFLYGIVSIVLLAYCLKRRSGRDPGRKSPSLDRDLPEDITIIHDDQSDITEPLQPQDRIYAHARFIPEANHDQAAILQEDEAAGQADCSNRQSLEDIPLC